MTKVEEYLKRAAECLELAKGAKNPDDKAKLLEIARAWRELAESGNTVLPPDQPKKN